MKIIEFEARGNSLWVKTDSLDHPEFVYPLDRFKNKAALEKEMMRKVQEREKKQEKCCKADLLDELGAIATVKVSAEVKPVDRA